MKGILELVTATFLFSLFGVFTRLLGDELGIFLQLLLRVGLMAAIFLVIGLIIKDFKKIEQKDYPLFIFRGLLIVVDFSCFFVAVNNLPLGLTLFIFYASNVITSFVFGTFVLKEKINKLKIIALFASIVGLFIMYTESFTNFKLFPLLAALISGACFGLNTSSSKKLTDNYGSSQVNFIAYFVSFILVTPLLLISRELIPSTISISTITELIGFSIVGVAAFYLTIEGFKFIEAQKASLIMLTELIFVVIIGFLFYSEIPSLNTIIGGLLIFSALAIPNIKFFPLSSKRG